MNSRDARFWLMIFAWMLLVPRTSSALLTADSSQSAPDTFSFELYDNLIFVSASVNGVASGSFLLDSGANITLLSEPFAESVGIDASRKRQKNLGAGESSTSVTFQKGVTVSLFGIKFPPEKVAIVPLTQLESTIGRRILGIIGAELFTRYVVTIDYAATQINLNEFKNVTAGSTGDRIPLKITGDRPFR